MKKINQENNAQRQKEILDKIRKNNSENNEISKNNIKKQTQKYEFESNKKNYEEMSVDINKEVEEEINEEYENKGISKKICLFLIISFLIGLKFGWDYFIPDYTKMSVSNKIMSISNIWNKEDSNETVAYKTQNLEMETKSVYGGESTVAFVDSEKAKIFRSFLISVGLYEDFNYNPTYDNASLMMYDLMGKHNPINGTEDKNIFIYFTAKDFYNYFNNELFLKNVSESEVPYLEEGLNLEGETSDIE